jgi:hypothetical protein
MSVAFGPERWAIEISKVLNLVLGLDHFPIDIAQVAREYSLQRFPEEPIALVRGETLPGFDGALYRAPAGKKGWGIFYNSAIQSTGRVNFTLAHELGHYLLHRIAYPDGIRCGEQDVVRWDSAYGQVEHQANLFAANVLMPLDDFRKLIAPRTKIALEMVSAAADRYRVSMVAAVLRWLSYTERRAVLVVSRDGFILWSRASEPALKSGAFFRTAGRTVSVPGGSLASQTRNINVGEDIADHAAGVWFNEAVREMAVFSEQYDFVLSLLLLEDRPAFSIAQEHEEDAFDRFTRQ